MPGLKTIGVMHNATDPMFRAWGERTMADARKPGIEPIQLGLNPSPRRAVSPSSFESSPTQARHRHDRDPRLSDRRDEG